MFLFLFYFNDEKRKNEEEICVLNQTLHLLVVSFHLYYMSCFFSGFRLAPFFSDFALAFAFSFALICFIKKEKEERRGTQKSGMGHKPNPEPPRGVTW